MKEKNSFIELYRFLFSLWVVYFHGYFFLPKTQFFNWGYIAVDFFFVLSGFFILHSITKFHDKPFLQSYFDFSYKRLKKLNFTFLISMLFASIYFFLNISESLEYILSWYGICAICCTLIMYIVSFITKSKNMFIISLFLTFFVTYFIGIFGYMWYIPSMILAFGLVFVLRKLVKSNKWFFISLVMVVIISYILYFTICIGWGIFRATGGVSLGIIASLIPKIKIRAQKFNWNIVFGILSFLSILLIALIPKTNLIFEIVLILILFPALLYFTNQVQFSNKYLNFLGSLSFGLYAYQTILRILEDYNIITSEIWLFAILIALVLCDRFIHYLIQKKQHNNITINKDTKIIK